MKKLKLWWRRLNVWRQLREERSYILTLEQKCDELCRRADEAEAIAFQRASEYYYTRLRQEEERNKHLIANAMTIANLTPLNPIFAQFEPDGRGPARDATGDEA